MPNDLLADNLRSKVLKMVDEAITMMDGYKKHGGKIIINIPRRVLSQERKVKVAAFQEWEV